MIGAIHIDQLFELVWASLLAGLAVAITFSLVIIGVARSEDCRRNRRAGSATAYAALSAVAGVLFLGGVAFGISVIAAK